jgi:hypothetical protein
VCGNGGGRADGERCYRLRHRTATAKPPAPLERWLRSAVGAGGGTPTAGPPAPQERAGQDVDAPAADNSGIAGARYVKAGRERCGGGHGTDSEIADQLSCDFPSSPGTR